MFSIHLSSADMGGQTAVNLTSAVSDMEAGYIDAVNRSDPDFLDLDLGVLTSTTQDLTPGLYNWASNRGLFCGLTG